MVAREHHRRRRGWRSRWFIHAHDRHECNLHRSRHRISHDPCRERVHGQLRHDHGHARTCDPDRAVRCRHEPDLGLDPSVSATIQDANGNPVTTGADSTRSVTFSQTAGTGSVSGLTSVTAVGGVAQVTVTGVLGGSVTLRASATLTAGPTNSNTLTFTVVSTNVAPNPGVINGASPVTEGSSGWVYTSTASDPDAGDTLTYLWSITSGNGTINGSATSSSVTMDFGDGPSTVVLHLVVDDGHGHSVSPADKSVTVNNVAPTGTADDATVTVDEGDPAANTGTYFDPGTDTVLLTASVGSVVDNNDGTWSWSFTTTDGPDDSQTVTIYGDDGDVAAAGRHRDLQPGRQQRRPDRHGRRRHRHRRRGRSGRQHRHVLRPGRRHGLADRLGRLGRRQRRRHVDAGRSPRPTAPTTARPSRSTVTTATSRHRRHRDLQPGRQQRRPDRHGRRRHRHRRRGRSGSQHRHVVRPGRRHGLADRLGRLGRRQQRWHVELVVHHDRRPRRQPDRHDLR